MKIKVIAILILCVRCDYGSSRYAALDSKTAPPSEGYKSTPLIEKATRFINSIGAHLFTIDSKIHENFNETRDRIIRAEKKLMTGSVLPLNDLESRVNNIFMKYKTDELNFGLNNTDCHAAGLHFFKAKGIIDKSKIFHFLKKMPKGAILHIHNTASVSSDWIVRNLSYMPGLLRCTRKSGISILSFRKSKEHDCETSYVNVNKERSLAYNTTIYDKYFEKLITLYTPNPENDYSSINPVWTKFQNIFSTINDAISYINAFRAYHWQMLKEMYEDNIMYAEVRISLKKLYDANGRIYEKETTVNELLALVNKFRKEYPKFFDIKLILTLQRNNEKKILQRLQEYLQLHSKFPNFIIGFDLVGQEDKGKPLINFIHLFQQFPRTTYFFHAGETNNFGTSTDDNLYDAILLNSKRIGHGYMLMKHPLLRQIVKSRQIAVEVSPISNQVLHLLVDLRNHPAGIFLSENIPIVISNDDPGFWKATGLSYDFYYAIMSFASQRSGLEILKMLALNSLKFSALNNIERNNALSLWEKDWSTFLFDVLNEKIL